MRKLIAGLAAAASLGLAACGSATVDNDNGAETSTSVASSERGVETESTSASASAENRAPAPALTATGRAPEDRGAEEISAIPSPEADASGRDADFIGALGDKNIDIAGVEEQLAAAAQRVCAEEEPITLNAIAGQLIEQGRTELDYEQLAQILVGKARSVYC